MKKALLAAAVLCIIGITTSCTPKDNITVDTSKAPELRTQADSLIAQADALIAQANSHEREIMAIVESKL